MEIHGNEYEIEIYGWDYEIWDDYENNWWDFYCKILLNF